MKRFIQGEDRAQGTLLPELLDDYVTDTNPVRVVDVFVDELDLGKLGFAGVDPASTGRPAYHPAVLLKLYIYGYLNRIQSSRRLEREAQRNVELMWLTGRLMPDFKTIANFRKDNGRAIRKICSLILASCGSSEHPLFEAALMGDKDKVKSLLDAGVRVDATNQYGMQVIHEAAGNGSGDRAGVIKILLAAGAKVDAVDSKGRQPIVYAVETESGIEAVKVLLAAGAKVDTLDNEGMPLIQLAAQTNSTAMVKVLLDHGALINAQDKNGDSPLHWASRRDNTDMVKYLLAAGANPNLEDKNGDQPLHWAARFGNFGNTEIIQSLLAAGANEGSQNKDGYTPKVIANHIGPSETDSGDMKGSLDEATHNYIRNNLAPIFIRAKMCSVYNGWNGCVGKDIILCIQTNSLSCDLYGISDESIIKEITESMQTSGLRIKRVTFWRNIHAEKSYFEKPIYEFKGPAENQHS